MPGRWRPEGLHGRAERLQDMSPCSLIDSESRCVSERGCQVRHVADSVMNVVAGIAVSDCAAL